MSHMDPTADGLNPTTGGTPANNRFGERIGRPYRKYLDGAAIDAEMSAPDALGKCAWVDSAARAEFLVRAPDGVTSFTVHYGRWISAEKNHGAAFAGPLEIGSLTVTGSSVGAVAVTPPFDTETDAIWAYIDSFTGTVTAGQSFALWFRGLPRA